jgi:ABC-type amino acid transport substrate-binding protein
VKGRLPTRWVVVGVVLLLLVVVALGLLMRGGGDDGALERVQSTGELRVGLDASFPPFETLDAEGNVVGIDADLAQAIAGALDAEAVFVNVGFDGLYDALLAGRVDVVISGLPYDPRWTQDVIYSDPYFNAGQLLVVRANDTAFDEGSGIGMPKPQERMLELQEGMPELAGRTVAVEWGSLADMEARRLGQAADGMKTLPQPTARDALNALVAGQADAAIADAVSVYQFIGENGEAVRIVGMLTDEPYVTAARIKSPRLAEAINEALIEVRESGALEQLMDRWF